MNYDLVNYPLQGRATKDCFICSRIVNQQTIISLLNKRNYEEFWSTKIEEETFISSVYNRYIVLYNFKNYGYYKVDCQKREREFVESYLVPEYYWNSDIILYLDRSDNKYKCLGVNGTLLFEFESKFPVSNLWVESGVLFYFNNEKENNWIKCLNPKDGKEKWHIEFPWQFDRLEKYKNLIILDYQAYDNFRIDQGFEGERDWYNPERFTIVLNGVTGEEIWRLPYTYSKIDYKNGVLLSSFDSTIIEVDLSTGSIISEITVELKNDFGYFPWFVDLEGIYYATHEGFFGKVNRDTGLILWEFDLIDKKGIKRKLSDWVLLGNGNLVLQAIPNHPNGDLTCIFNPEGNLQYSKVKNGERISPDYT